MIVYLDSSALLKRVVTEAESDALEDHLAARVAADDALVTSSLAAVEVSRALRRRSLGGHGEHGEAAVDATALAGQALAGVAEAPLGPEVVGLARRCGTPQLRTLDALHLATALLLDADEVVVYDRRLRDAVTGSGLVASAPGQSSSRA